MIEKSRKTVGGWQRTSLALRNLAFVFNQHPQAPFSFCFICCCVCARQDDDEEDEGDEDEQEVGVADTQMEDGGWPSGHPAPPEGVEWFCFTHILLF